jgi:N-glycosylase/DNA lyase
MYDKVLLFLCENSEKKLMNKLYEILKKYTTKDAINFENKDRQFIAIKKLIEKHENKEDYLMLIMANAIVCYQLS